MDVGAPSDPPPGGSERDRLSLIEPLTAAHRYSMSRGLARYIDDVGPELTRRSIRRAVDSGGRLVLSGDDRAPDATTTVTSAEWESGLLGERVGHVGEIVATPDVTRRTDAVADLLADAGDGWARSGGGLLIVRIDIDDTDAVVGAERAGFHVLETSATYLFDYTADNVVTHRSRGYEVRRHDRGAVAEIPSEAFAPLLRWVRDTDRTGHFYRDRRLDIEAVRRLYLTWLDNTFAGRYCDVVYTAWRNGEVVGFLAWKEDPELAELCGTKVLRPGLGAAVAPEGRGALGDMYAAVCAEAPLDARLVEHITQAGNEAVLTTWARFGALRPASCHYVLHGWFDDRTR